MKPTKYSFAQTAKIDLGTKIIHKYPSPTGQMDIGIMVVNGRHPADEKKFILETECQFIMYVMRGVGIVYVEAEEFKVEKGDVVFVPKNHKFAVRGDFQYI